jgi:hypothetical protein
MMRGILAALRKDCKHNMPLTPITRALGAQPNSPQHGIPNPRSGRDLCRLGPARTKIYHDSRTYFLPEHRIRP